MHICSLQSGLRFPVYCRQGRGVDGGRAGRREVGACFWPNQDSITTDGVGVRSGGNVRAGGDLDLIGGGFCSYRHSDQSGRWQPRDPVQLAWLLRWSNMYHVRWRSQHSVWDYHCWLYLILLYIIHGKKLSAKIQTLYMETIYFSCTSSLFTLNLSSGKPDQTIS